MKPECLRKVAKCAGLAYSYIFLALLTCVIYYKVVESGGKNIEVAVMTKEHGLRQLEEAEIDAIVAVIEEEKAAAEAAKKAPPRET